MIALAATLLVGALATAPARAQEVPVVPTDAPAEPAANQQPSDPPLPGPGTPASTPGPGTDAVPVDPGPAPADNLPANTSGGGDATPVAGDSGGGGSTDGSGDGSSGSGGSPVQKQPAHVVGDDRATPTSSTPTSTPASSTDQSGQPSPPASGNPDAWLGQDTFVVDRTGGGGGQPPAGPGALRGTFGGLYALSAASRASRMEAKARRGHEVAKISALGGPPGSGPRLPDQNPFFNLLSGSGGSAAGLALASILAVLGGALLLPRDRSTRFRTPTVTWRPLAYVPPIELPG